MNRIIALLLSLTILISCTACSTSAFSFNSPSVDHEEQFLHGEKPQLPDHNHSTSTGQEKNDEQASDRPTKEPESTDPAEGTSPVEPETPTEIPPEPETPDTTVRTIDPSKPMVALTFDDGPHAVYTDMILDILEENGAVATFFEVGKNVANCPGPLGRMVELGCEIGSHSNAHKDLSKLKTTALLDDLATADQAFIDAVGFAPTLLRPPYGSVNKTVKYSTGRSVITWTVDTEDWMSKDTDKIVSYVKSLSSLDGEIVLMHSSYESTVNAVDILVPWLIQQGYQLVTVSELMAYYYGELLQTDQFYGYTYFTTHGKTDTPVSLPEKQEPADAETLPETDAQEPTTPPQAPTDETQPPVQEDPSNEAPPAPEEPTIPASPDAPIYSVLPSEEASASQSGT